MKKLLLALVFVTAAHAQRMTPAQLAQLRVEAARMLHVDTPLPPLSPKIYGTLDATPEIAVTRVTYATQYGMRVPAIVYSPKHPHGKVPAIVVVCGHGGDKSSWYAVYTGMLYASAGAVVVTYDPIGEFERSETRASETNEHDRAIPGLTQVERVGGLMIEDAQQAVRYAASLPQVDRNRIGLVGYSTGSFQGIIAAAIAGPQLPRIRAVVLSGGGNLDGANEYWDTNPKPNCQAGPYKTLNFLPGGANNRGPMLYAMRAQFGPTLVLNGTEDTLITKFNELEPFFEKLRPRIAAITGSQTNLPESLWFAGAGHRPSWMTRPAALWLDQQLHFPDWTEAQIESFPTIRAADWSAKTGVRISHGYQIEVKEGGVPTLDLHLPGLTREQLTVVPDAEWRANPAPYTLAGWTPHALASQNVGH